MGKIIIYNAETGVTTERDMTPEEEAQREADQAAWEEAQKNAPYEVSKMVMWARMTDPEAETVQAAMLEQPARMQGIWAGASKVVSNSQFFGDLQAFLTGVLGEERAAQILAPMTPEEMAL